VERTFGVVDATLMLCKNTNCLKLKKNNYSEHRFIECFLNYKLKVCEILIFVNLNSALVV